MPLGDPATHSILSSILSIYNGVGSNPGPLCINLSESSEIGVILGDALSTLAKVISPVFISSIICRRFIFRNSGRLTKFSVVLKKMPNHVYCRIHYVQAELGQILKKVIYSN